MLQISQGYVDAIFNKYGQNAQGRMPIMVGLCHRLCGRQHTLPCSLFNVFADSSVWLVKEK